MQSKLGVGVIWFLDLLPQVLTFHTGVNHDFIMGDELGVGGFGSVYLAKSCLPGRKAPAAPVEWGTEKLFGSILFCGGHVGKRGPTGLRFVTVS